MVPLEHTRDRAIPDGGGRFAHPEFNRAFFHLFEKRRYRGWPAERGPKVGDLYLEPGDDPEQPFRRFTYDWGDNIQGNTGNGSFHLDEDGSLDYSGGLSEPMPKTDFTYTERLVAASCWIFDSLWPRAHAGVGHRKENQDDQAK